MQKAHPIAVLISDLHLSLLQPACRADKDWLEVQAEYLCQVRQLAEPPITKDGRQSVALLPVICAGDIFDRWNPPPEIINFALKHLPEKMYAVPGQHDLPNHRIADMHRSGYGVLKEAGKIIDISDNENANWNTEEFVLHGFGWGQEIKPLNGPLTGRPHVAVIHRYCWMEGKQYPGAPDDSNVSAFRKQLKGYDVAVFGDNHQHFIAQTGDCTVFNCGGFIRRKSDEIHRKPCVGILYSDGTVKKKNLDTTIDVFHDVVPNRSEVPIDMQAFIDGLETLGEHGLDFKTAVENHLRSEDLDPETKKIILAALEAHDN